MPGPRGPRRRGAGAILTAVLPAWLALSPPPSPSTPQTAGAPGLLRQIRDEVLGLDRYAGEDFNRGEFHLGPGDDDTYKTHAVGILVRGEAQSFRMTIEIHRLEYSKEDPRVCYARDPRSVICRFPGKEVEIVRSDLPAGELEDILSLVLKAVIDKKALLKRQAAGRPGLSISP
jgi:hypothetical protein